MPANLDAFVTFVASRAGLEPLLGGSWVVISGVISPLIWIITTVTLLITLLITTHEPPSINDQKVSVKGDLGGLVLTL